MYNVYFCYQPRTIILVNWKNIHNIDLNGETKKAYETLTYGKYTDWLWTSDFYPYPLAPIESKQSKENTVELRDMEDAIEKLFKEGIF